MKKYFIFNVERKLCEINEDNMPATAEPGIVLVRYRIN